MRTAGGPTQPSSNTTQDAPPVAVSRVGCCELSLGQIKIGSFHQSAFFHTFLSPVFSPVIASRERRGIGRT